MPTQSNPTVHDTTEQGIANNVVVHDPTLFVSDLPEDQAAIFRGILAEFYRIYCLRDADEIRAASDVLCNRVVQEVTSHPVLAKAISDDCHHHWSLLALFCGRPNEEDLDVLYDPVMKLLIQENPSALLWRGSPSAFTNIHVVARHVSRCVVLLPWIAEHFGWVLDHVSCNTSPPHLSLVGHYCIGACNASVVKDFYELYPQGLGQDDSQGFLPLHYCLVHTDTMGLLGDAGSSHCKLIKWMMHQYPESLWHETSNGQTPLYCACAKLVHRGCTNAYDAEVCCFLAEECPELVRRADGDGALLIHYITWFSHRAPAQKVIVQLLRAYPQSIDVACPYSPEPRSFPFVQSVFPLLEEEVSVKEEISALTDMSAAFCEAAARSEDVLPVTLSEVFKDWAKLRKATLTIHLEHTIPERIMEVSREIEGEGENDQEENEQGEDEQGEDEGDDEGDEEENESDEE